MKIMILKTLNLNEEAIISVNDQDLVAFLAMEKDSLSLYFEKFDIQHDLMHKIPFHENAT